jgi:hypothetical protein
MDTDIRTISIENILIFQNLFKKIQTEPKFNKFAKVTSGILTN